MSEPNLEEMIALGLNLAEANIALEAYYSSRIEGAGPMTANELYDLIRDGQA